jgi:tetratricopeptide (TPR) repeat protein
MIRLTFRWSVAALVTVASFAVATFLCGAVLLTMRDAAVRWGIAAGLGVAVAALAALWGHSYATAVPERSEHQPLDPAQTADSRAGGSGNVNTGAILFSPVVQGRNITVTLPPQITPAMAGLARPSSTFVGRTRDLEALLEALAPNDVSASSPESPDAQAWPQESSEAVLVTVVGMGGIGKTELALQAAHAALRRGWFPGGVLFVNMLGYGPGLSLTPAQAAAGFVRALGIPDEQIPVEAQDLERLLRSALDTYAANGRPVLVVVDNIIGAGQAASLLPAHPACRAIVTSRHTLSDLDARIIDLGTLDIGPSVELLRGAIEVARPGDRRVIDHPEDACQVAELCAGLPLALRIAAALLADNPLKPLAAMAADLQEEADRLPELSSRDVAFTSVFDLSYWQLSNVQARLFRLLSVNPGPDVSASAAAALAGLAEAETRRALEALARAHLIERGVVYGRWRMHDLLRLYSASGPQAGPDVGGSDETPERGRAQERLLAHYVRLASAACRHIRALPDSEVPSDFGGPDEALSWFDNERPCLLAAVAMAADTGRDGTAFDLAGSLITYFDLRGRVDEWLTITNLRLTAARRLTDPRAEGEALRSRSYALYRASRHTEAITAAREAAVIFREAGDRIGEAKALGNLANPLMEIRELDEAVAVNEDVVAIFREVGNRQDEGMALDNLGLSLREAGRFAEAIIAHQDAIAIFCEIGDRNGEGYGRTNLGQALREAGRLEEAIAEGEIAIAIFRKTGDRAHEAISLENSAATLLRSGRADDAISASTDAASIYEETGDRHGQGMAIYYLASAMLQAQRLGEAIEASRIAVTRFRETGDLLYEARTLHCLGLAQHQSELFEEAAITHGASASIFREAGAIEDETAALARRDEAAAAAQRRTDSDPR